MRGAESGVVTGRMTAKATGLPKAIGLGEMWGRETELVWEWKWEVEWVKELGVAWGQLLGAATAVVLVRAKEEERALKWVVLWVVQREVGSEL